MLSKQCRFVFPANTKRARQKSGVYASTKSYYQLEGALQTRSGGLGFLDLIVRGTEDGTAPEDELTAEHKNPLTLRLIFRVQSHSGCSQRPATTIPQKRVYKADQCCPRPPKQGQPRGLQGRAARSPHSHLSSVR